MNGDVRGFATATNESAARKAPRESGMALAEQRLFRFGAGAQNTNEVRPGLKAEQRLLRFGAAAPKHKRDCGPG